MQRPSQTPGSRHRRRLGAAIVSTATALSAIAIAPALVKADTPPAQIIGLAAGNTLVQFSESTPGNLVRSVAVSGLLADEQLMSIETRPGTGQLLGLAITNTVGPDRARTYSIDALSGAAVPVGAATVDTIRDASRTTIDINPTVDRIRLVGSLDQSLRLNPNTGGLAATDTDLAPGGQQIVNVAYDQNVPASAAGNTTTLFGISSAGNLVRIGGINGTPSPNLGALSTVGALGVVPENSNVGFDISAQGGAFASIRVGGSTGLYTVNLANGTATLVGQIGNGTVEVTDITVLSTRFAPGAGQYTALASSSRLLDTRTTAKLAAGASTSVIIRGRGGVPAKATAAVLNVSITDPDGPGFATVWPSGMARPEASSLNIDSTNQTRAALVSVLLGTNGAADVFASAGSHVLVDVIGYYSPSTTGAGRLKTLTPARLLDTRNGIGIAVGAAKPAAAATVDVQVLGRGGVPATNVAAVVVTLTATQTTNGGYFTAHASGAPRPLASNLNASTVNEDVANLAIVPVGANGMISLFTENGSHLLVDVVGYFGSDGNALATPSGLFVPLVPGRLFDTRAGGGQPVQSERFVDVAVVGRQGVPATGVLGISGTVTADQTQGAGFVTVVPTGAGRPEVSSLNYNRAGQTVAGPIMIGLGLGGNISLYNQGGTHLIVDATGYFTS